MVTGLLAVSRPPLYKYPLNSLTSFSSSSSSSQSLNSTNSPLLFLRRRRSFPLRRISASAAGEDSGTPESRKPPRVTDEWGEPIEARGETPSQPDPPQGEDEDEWGKQASGSSDEYVAGGNGTAAVAGDDRLVQLKRCLVDTLYGTELGFRASAETRAEIFELVAQLEAENPNPAPTERSDLLDGNWILLFTAYSELFPVVAIANTPLLKVKAISQSIDSTSMTIVNATTLSSPGSTFSFSAVASYEVQSPSRIQVQIKEGSIKPPQISSSVDLPDSIDVFGQKIDLSPVQRTLNPVQGAVANATRSISRQPPLKIPIPGNRPKSWLLITYLDEDFRISRGDGGIFILAKEGSLLLDQIS